MASAEVSLPAVFATRTPYPLPSQKFMIPASWRRYQLSQLVNKVLALPTPVPFDFLIQGEVLRGTLSEWCSDKGFGMEETLEIEYIESLLPPQKLANIPHDDWVSSVSCILNGQFITGSYDSRVRVFDSSQNATHEINGHTGPVTSICVFLSATSESPVVASASHDGTARLTALETDSSRPLASLHLHASPISSIASSKSGSHLLTASWDSFIGLWDTKIPPHDEVPREQEERKKRRKVGEENSSADAKRKAPVSVLKSHTSRVMKAIFSRDSRHAFSCGLDSTIRTWDVDSGVCLNTMTAAEKPFLDLAIPSEGDTIFASSTDRTVAIYDTRQLSAHGTGSSSSIGSLVHPATPSCLAVSPVNFQHVASGCYDGVVRIWDIRSVKEAISNFLVTPKVGGDGKVLAIDWTKGIIAAGGEGGLDIWKVPEEGSSSAPAS